MTIARVFPLVAAVLLPGLASTTDTAFDAAIDSNVRESVYESLDGVRIGRVFLSPAERTRLDAAKRNAPRAPDKPTAARQRSSSSDAAMGFIINRSGTTRIFQNGDFVRSSRDVSSLRFPGDIEISRSGPAPEGQKLANDASDTEVNEK